MVGCIAICGFMFAAWGWVDFGGVSFLGCFWWLWVVITVVLGCGHEGGFGDWILV